jgi:cytochrome c
MKSNKPLTLLIAATLIAAMAATPDRGREIFNQRCTGCHALDEEKTGPRLRNVYGNRAAAAHQFPYSDALRSAGLTWTDSNLDKWLADPEALVPNNDMPMRVAAAEDRAAIIAYLKSIRTGR